MPVAKKIFKENIFPFFKNTAQSYFKTKEAEKKFEKSITKYLAKIAGQCSTINTIAFQNSPKSLNDLYIPLTLEREGKKLEIVVNDGIDIFQHNNHILVNDTAGMGKSTISKKIVSNIIAEGLFTPVFIELRQIEKKPIDEQILLNFGISDNFGVDFLSKFPIIYIFDGLDEVPVDKKKEIVELLKVFIESVGESRILITSRQETFLSEFYSFARYKIKPLERKQSSELLKKYDPSGLIANKLITSIAQNVSGLSEFLSTPLYVSLLFCAYRHKTVIPRKKDLFYSQVYDALFESHDLSKEVGFVRPKFSKLDSAEFHAVLRRLGFWCMVNNGTIEFQKDELEIVVRDLLSKMTGIKASAPDFVKDLVTTVPLFVKEGPSMRWSHKSLMEYFAAMFICNDAKNKQEKILIHYYKSEAIFSHINVLELCSDIDFSCFRASIVKQVLEDFHSFFEQELPKYNQKISRKEISKRIALTFDTKYTFRLVEIPKKSNSLWGASPLFPSDHKSSPGYLHSEIIYHVDKNDLGLQVSFELGKARRILQMIRSKIPEIFENSPRLKYGDEGEDCVKSVFDRTSLIMSRYYILNTDKGNKVNSIKNFEHINKILRFSDNFILDEPATRAELKKIENDRSNGVDGLLEGLL